MEEELQKLRAGIDAVDREIVEKLNQRCKLVREIGQWKKARRQPIYVPQRERQLLDKLMSINEGPLENDSLAAIYREIMSAAIKLEHPLVIGCPAASPGFQRETVLEKFGHGVTTKEFASFPEICTALLAGEIDYAIAPIENTARGVVTELLDALAASEVKIVTEFTVPSSENDLSRFLVLGMQTALPSGKDKCSFCVELPDRTGALQEALRPFGDYGISVTMLESRPLKKKSFEYRFFVDILGHEEDAPVKAAFAELRSKCSFFKILGSFPRMN